MTGKVDLDGHLKAIDQYWDAITDDALKGCGGDAEDIAILSDLVKRIKKIDGVDVLARTVYREDCDDERVLLAYFFGFLHDEIHRNKGKLKKMVSESEAERLGKLIDTLVNAIGTAAKALMFDPDDAGG